MNRAARLLFLWMLILVPAFFSGGCQTIAYPPAKIAEPVAIYFAQYNIHSSILLPVDGKFVDYSFGDWNYAALRHKLPNDALEALFISWQSTFERRYIDVDPHTGGPLLYDNPDLVIRLTADRELVNRRIDELEFRFRRDMDAAGKDGQVVESDGRDIYLKDPEHYSFNNNCNRVTAATLRALGFTVDGPANTNQFHFAQAAHP